MGLDMYLNRRNKLSKEQEQRINFINKRLKQIDKSNQEIYDTVYNQALKEIGPPPKDFFSDAYTEHNKKISEYVDSHVPEQFKNDSDVFDELNKEKSSIYDSDEIGYWRKHADLNGYFQELYIKRGGKDSFNCVPLLLSKEDCEQVLEMAKEIVSGKKTMTKSEGFFWGETLEEDWQDTINIFESCLEETDFDTQEIYYSCWW